MLSGYVPGAEGVLAVGKIAKELGQINTFQPGKFFWVLDPVMGDNGKIYVSEDVVPAYKSLLPYADLVIPNQFEAEYVIFVSILFVNLLLTILSLKKKTDCSRA